MLVERPESRSRTSAVNLSAIENDELVAIETVRALLDAITAVVAETEPEALVHRVVEAAAKLIEADEAVCAFFDAAGDLDSVVKYADGGMIFDLQVTAPAAAQDVALVALLADRLSGSADVLRLANVIAMPFRARDQQVGLLYLTRKTGRFEFGENAERRLRAFAGPANVAVANARAFEIGRRRERWLETLAHIVTLLLSGTELADVLPMVIRQARDIIEADGAAVALPNADASLAVVRYTDGFEADALRDAELPVDTTFVGIALRRGVTVQVSELATDRRLVTRHTVVDKVGPAIYVPLGSASAVRGVLFVYNRLGGRAFDEHAVDMLNAFAAQVAVALELAERREDAMTVAVFEDRERIARDLHDVVIQRLFAIGLTLDGASRSIADEDTGRRVSRAVDELDETIKEIRDTIFELQRPFDSSVHSLRARIVGVIDQEIAALGFVPSLRFEGLIDTAVPPALGDHVVAVLREALSNVARHARATQVEVKVSASATTLTLLIEDNGIGMQASARRSGVRNMETRAAVHSGTVRLQPVEPHGTRVVWSVPVRRVRMSG